MNNNHDEILAVQEAVRGILEGSDSPSVVWTSLVDAGFAAVAAEGIEDIPLAPLLAGIAEEVGRRLSPVPFLAHSVIAGTVLSRFPGDTAARHAAGETVVLAVPLSLSVWDGIANTVTARVVEGGWIVDGSVAAVLNADEAQCYLLPVVVEGRTVLLAVDRADQGCAAVAVESADASRPLGDLRFASAGARWVAEGAAAEAAVRQGLAVGTACLAAETVGAASVFLDETIAYLKERWAFGRPIGSFQAVKHSVVDLFTELSQARALLRDALSLLTDTSDVSDEALIRLTLAKVHSGRALEGIANRGILLHGAIGFTWELGAHRFVRRSMTDRLLLGDRDALVDVLGTRISATAAGDDECVSPDGAESWLQQNAPQFVGPRDHVGHFAVLSEDEKREQVQRARRWEALKAGAGHAGIAVPRQFGGQEGSQYDALRFQTFERRYDLPHWIFGITHGMILPTMLRWGSSEQKDRYVRPMLDGSELWCQLFSEPGAGSDLAMASTRAVRVDGGWRLSGQKVWNSGADTADCGLLVARTDPDVPKHAGLTVFVVPMDAAGMTVRPIIQASGSALFCEVFLEDVFIPDSDVVGDVGNGWRVALTTLMNERVALTGDGVPFHRAFDLAREHAADLSPAARARLVGVMSLHRALAAMSEQVLEGIRTGSEPGPEGSVNKLLTGRAAIAVADFAAAVLGVELLRDRDWHEYVVGNLGLLIGGGTEEIQKNVIAERVLGLPSEPKALVRLSWAQERAQTGMAANDAR